MSELNSLSDASSAALSSLEAPAPVVDTAPPVSPAAADPTLAPATPPEANIPNFEGTRHKVKVRGTEEEIEYQELLKGYSRTADYTRSKQELAERMKQAQEMADRSSVVQKEFEQIYGSDPLVAQAAEVAKHFKVSFSEAFKAVVQHQQEQLAPKAPGVAGAEDPIITASGARQIAEQQVAALKQQIASIQQNLQGWTQEQIAAAKNEIATSQQSQGYTTEINSMLSDIFTQNPVLTAVDGMEDLLRFKVYQADPATVEEAKDLFVRFASEQADKLNTQFTELNKGRQIKKETLVSGGIEPPGGSGPTPQPTNHNLGSQGLRDSAEAYLNSLLR